MQEITLHHPNLLAGLIDDQVEFFAPAENMVLCITGGKVLSFEEIPGWIIERIETDMINNPKVLKQLDITQLNKVSVYKYIYHMFGGVDQEPDIDRYGTINRTEYFNQVDRNIEVNEGHLTKSELAVLKLVHLPDKLIADQLFISEHTVLSHWQNMRNKTGLTGKVELAIWATKKGII